VLLIKKSGAYTRYQLIVKLYKVPVRVYFAIYHFLWPGSKAEVI